DRRDPVQPRVVPLLDVVDAVHEERELLELRPLVVRGGDRNLDLDRLVDRADPGAVRALLATELERRAGRGRAAAEYEHRVAELVAALLLHLDPGPGVLQVLGHPLQLAPELLVVGEPRRGGQEAHALGGAALRLGSVADRREQLLAELLVARERERELRACGRVVLHGLRLGTSEHLVPFLEVFLDSFRAAPTPNTGVRVRRSCSTNSPTSWQMPQAGLTRSCSRSHFWTRSYLSCRARRRSSRREWSPLPETLASPS